MVVDCQDQMPAIELIAGVRKLPINRSTLIIALVDGREQVRDIFGQGANFIVYKPVSVERAASSLRAARGLMAREKRIKLEDRSARTGVDYLRQRGECGGHAAGLERRWTGHPVRTPVASTLQGLLSIQFAGRQILGPACPAMWCGRTLRDGWESALWTCRKLRGAP